MMEQPPSHNCTILQSQNLLFKAVLFQKRIGKSYILHKRIIRQGV